MAAPDVTAVQGIAGTVTFAGAAVGILADIQLIPIQRTFVLTAEEYGGKRVEEYELGRDWILVGVARGKDAAMFDALFSSSSGGTITETLSDSKGAPLSARSGKLVFTPRDATHPSFTLWRALPRVRDSGRFPFSVHNRLSMAVVFSAIPDSTGRDVTFG
jgi:hypothetical protein